MKKQEPHQNHILSSKWRQFAIINLSFRRNDEPDKKRGVVYVCEKQDIFGHTHFNTWTASNGTEKCNKWKVTFLFSLRTFLLLLLLLFFISSLHNTKSIVDWSVTLIEYQNKPDDKFIALFSEWERQRGGERAAL